MKKAPHKRITKQAMDLQSKYNIYGLNPLSAFVFTARWQVWFWVTALPMTFVAGFAAAVAVGFIVWAPAFFIAAGLGLLAGWWFWATLAWFAWRGWADAIMAIEHKQRKRENYGR